MWSVIQTEVASAKPDAVKHKVNLVNTTDYENMSKKSKTRLKNDENSNATVTVEKAKLLALIDGFTKTSTDGAFYGICVCCVAQGEICEATRVGCKETIYRYMTDIERGGNESSENS